MKYKPITYDVVPLTDPEIQALYDLNNDTSTFFDKNYNNFLNKTQAKIDN